MLGASQHGNGSRHKKQAKESKRQLAAFNDGSTTSGQSLNACL
jgi:hypothetical protein